MNAPRQLQSGDVVLTNSKKGFLSSAIRFFSRSKYSHSALAIGDVRGVPCVLEADMVVTTTPFINYVTNDNVDFEVWRPVGLTDSGNQQAAVHLAFTHYASRTYGFAQLLWFMWRWVAESFGVDMRSKKNWFPGGDICSEVVYHYLRWMCEGQPHGWTPLWDTLAKWEGNSLHPGDLARFIRRYPNHFELMDEKKG